MQRKVFMAGLILLVSFVMAFRFYLQNSKPFLKTKHMQISSSVFQSNTLIPSKYTCDGENINPPLRITDVPKDTQSLVLIMDDPDAPAGTWVHWLVWNIHPLTKEIGENSLPANAMEGRTSFGKIGYGGPCPPSNTHRYFFKLYALNTKLNLINSTDKAALLKAMEGHILEQAEVIGTYQRR